MKKNIMFVMLGSCVSFFLAANSVPHFAQSPSSFNSVGLDTNTSRYFFQKVTLYYYANETYAFSLQNTGGSTARISAIGCATNTPVASRYFNIYMYKNGVISDVSYMPITNSALQISKSGTFISGADQVYELQAVGTPGAVRGFEAIAKEGYSVTIAPGETLIATLAANGSAEYNIIIMWEEIIN